MLFFDIRGGSPEKAILQKDYHLRIPLKARTAAALMDAWNQGLNQLVRQASADFASKEPGGIVNHARTGK